MSWKGKLGWMALGLVILVIVVLTGAYFYLKSAAFEKFALAKLSEEVDTATGSKTTIGAMNFSLSTLTANLYDITMRGTESEGSPPLLHADKLTVQIRIESLLHSKFSLRKLWIHHPVAHVQVNAEGRNNFPAPPISSNTHTSVFDLAIEHAEIADGEFDYNDRKTPLNADLYNINADVRYMSGINRYDGVLSYQNGRFQYATYAPISHSLDLKFSATPAELTIESASLRFGSSNAVLQGRLENYSNPVINGNYLIDIHAQDFAQMSPSVKSEGDVTLSGKLHYQPIDKEPLLRTVSITGKLTSGTLTAAISEKKVILRNLRAEYQLSHGNFTFNDLSVDTLRGKITAKGEVRHLGSTPDSIVRASLQDISLHALQQAMRAEAPHGAAISGNISGTADATWQGHIETLHAHSDLSLKAEAVSTTRSLAEEVPVNGSVHASYDGSHQSIELHNTVLIVPSARASAQGTISTHSNLRVQVATNDLHQLESLVSSFQTAENPFPAVAGKATVSAVIQGSTERPSVSAQLAAQDLRVEGSQWKSASLAIRASPSDLNIQSGTLTNAHRGEVSFSANIQLHHWSYQPSGRIQGKINAQQISLTELQQLADQHYPVSGQLSAKLSLDGSQLNPDGNGRVEISNAIVYGQPIQKMSANVHTDSGVLVSTLSAVSKAGTINGNLNFAPQTKAYKVSVDAPAIVLQRLEFVQAKNLQLTGTVTSSLSGAGTIDNPQMSALLLIPQLQVKGKSVSDIQVQARVAEHRLDASLESKLSQIAVHAQVQVALTGDYEAQVSLDTGTIPIDTLVAEYVSSVPQGFQGHTQVHATLRGPLKSMERMEAHLSIPVLKASYESLQIGIASPIHADYVHDVLTLQPLDIEGTDTSLHLQGQFPVGGSSAPSLSANGSLNLRVLEIVAPSVKSSGSLNLNVKTTGTSAKPVVQGQMQLKNAAVSTQDLPIALDQLNGTLDIDNNRVQIANMMGKLGGGTVTLGGGITYRPSIQFNLAIQSESVRLLYPTGLRTLLDTNLAFTGNTAASTLTGRVFIDNLSFTPDFDLSSFANQFSENGTVTQPGFTDNIKLAVAVQSRENLNATSSQVSISGEIALQVGGTAANPVITGRTILTSGELFYRNVRYQLQQGVVTFDDPNQTHPVLNVSVTTTIEQYNLTLTLRGPLDRLMTSYVSDPPLATADVINLVAQGKTTQESAASNQSTDSIIASQALGQISSGVQKLVGISSLEIDPTLGGNGQNPSAQIAIQQRISKNLLFTFSTNVSEPGSEMVQGDYQINKRWSVSVERDQLGGISAEGRYHTRF